MMPGRGGSIVKEVYRKMKHRKHVSPAMAFAHVPRNLFDIISATDIIVVIGLTLEAWFAWIFGTFLLPEGLLGDRNGNGAIDG